MSKISFTISLPHDSPSGSLAPQFFLSCNNNTYLSVKGKDIAGARWGNGNVNQGYKNRFEYSVTAAKGITKFSLIMNTSAVLPPLSWALAGDKPKDKDESGKKGKRGSSKGSETSSSSRKSKTQAKLIGSQFHHHPRIYDRAYNESSNISSSDDSNTSSREKRVHRKDRDDRYPKHDRDEKQSRHPPRIEDSKRDDSHVRYKPRDTRPKDESSRDSSTSGEHRHRRKKKRTPAQFNPAFGDVVGDR